MPHNNKNNPFIIQKAKYGSLKGFSYRMAWTEDSLVSNTEYNEVVGKIFDFTKLKFIIFFISLSLLILISRTAWLQIIKGDYYYSLAEGNRIRIERIEAKRGIIYDRNLIPLVKNKANFLLYFIPSNLPDNEFQKNHIFKQISEILENLSSDDIKQMLFKIKQRSLEWYQPLFITDNIEYEKAMLLYLETKNMPGVILLNKAKREYNICEQQKDCLFSLSHILGYTAKINQTELKQLKKKYFLIDDIGKTGIEYFWENELRGENGQKYIEVDALGNEKKLLNITQAQDGYNLILSLDSKLQQKTEKILFTYLQKLKLNKASVIIMNPNNGEILTLISLPSYDNNIFTKGITQEEYNNLINYNNNFFNRSISGEYPPGSTFKLIMAVAALEDNIISTTTSFNSSGGIRISKWFFPDWRIGGHGITDVYKALSQSVNTFFYYIGGGYKNFNGLGLDRIIHYAELFGLGGQTGIDLPSEENGLLPTAEWKKQVKHEQWYIGDTYHLSIGQGDLLVTPLQIANLTSVFANNGTLYRPHLVKQILNNNNQLIKNIDTDPVRQNFINKDNIEIVKSGMRQAVTLGSARKLNSLPIQTAGKTGTAQWSSKNLPHAWFTGFAPYDHPEIVITVLIEEAGEGSVIAVSIAKEIMEWYFKIN